MKNCRSRMKRGLLSNLSLWTLRFRSYHPNSWWLLILTLFLGSEIKLGSQTNQTLEELANKKDESEDGNLQSSNGCLAVIPWVPPPTPSMHATEFGQQTDISEMMEVEATKEATMDVEDDVAVDQENVYVPGATNHSHQWQQQQCMIPQLPHNPSTPIVWYR